ncbi:hypothetical protein HMPREF3150_03372 [Pseudomonas aeruginosa]|nr:hypothetical protein HMPREF3150_03372 [Pseudomonas aeruginosa]
MTSAWRLLGMADRRETTQVGSRGQIPECRGTPDDAGARAEHAAGEAEKSARNG